MTLKVDLSQFTPYNSNKRLVIIGGPENPEYGTAIGSQLSFLSQGVSLSSGKAVNGRSSMFVFTDILGKEIVKKEPSYLLKNYFLKKIAFRDSFLSYGKMRKFQVGPGNPTTEEKKPTKGVTYHA